MYARCQTKALSLGKKAAPLAALWLLSEVAYWAVLAGTAGHLLTA